MFLEIYGVIGGSMYIMQKMIIFDAYNNLKCISFNKIRNYRKNKNVIFQKTTLNIDSCPGKKELDTYYPFVTSLFWPITLALTPASNKKKKFICEKCGHKII